ncbi:MAG: DUF4440 domain-containing protein [Pirellula sp.]|nr:DUF4440 domain-containing protein [Pirellula sp.]
MNWRRLAAFAAVSLFATAGVAADPPDAKQLQAAISASAELFAKAFTDRDAAALALLFTPEAECIDSDGTVFHGRKAIEAEYAARFAVAPKGAMTIAVTSIRPIAAGVVVEEGVSTFRPAAAEGVASRTRYTALHIHQSDDSWLVASVRELSEPEVSSHDRLQELAWLVGKWREDSGGRSLDTEWTWSEDGNALVSRFTLRGVDPKSRSGTHRVGWDAERKQFRSWVFDADGGAGEGWWARGADGSWSVPMHGVNAAGTRVSSVLTYVRDGVDTLTIAQQQRIVGDESLPAISSRVVRQPPQPTVPAAKK